MINGFPVQTAPLNADELALVPLFISGLTPKIGKSHAVKNSDIRKGMFLRGFKIPDARVRKIINYIRVNALVPKLCANSQGYYVASDNKELREYMDGLHDRIGAQIAVYNSLYKQMNPQLTLIP